MNILRWAEQSLATRSSFIKLLNEGRWSIISRHTNIFLIYFCLLCWKRMSPFSAPDSFSSFHSLPAGLFCWLIFESKCAQQILNCWLTFEQIMFSNWAIPPKSLPGHQGGRQSVTMCRRQRFIRATITTLEQANAGGIKSGCDLWKANRQYFQW